MFDIQTPFGCGFGFSVKTFNDYNMLALDPQEILLLSPNVVEKRKIEFCLGRVAAHSALEQINIRNIPVLKGKYNEPLWPPEVVGAISHSNKIAIAVATSKSKAAGIGIDIEIIDDEISNELIKQICTVTEANWVNDSKMHKLERLLMIFSAKESILKSFFPITNKFFGFLDAELVWDKDTGTFLGTLIKNIGRGYNIGYIFTVGCRIIGRYVFTYMKLPSVDTNLGNLQTIE